MPLDRTNLVRIAYVARRARTRFDLRARTLNLTRAQWRTIAAIRYNEGSTQREIAGKLEVGSVTVGRIVDRLEQAGWIERRPDAADRRAYRLYISAKAQPMLDRLSALGDDEERIAFAGLSMAEQAMLAELLDRVIANFDEDGGCGRAAE